MHGNICSHYSGLDLATLVADCVAPHTEAMLHISVACCAVQAKEHTAWLQWCTGIGTPHGVPCVDALFPVQLRAWLSLAKHACVCWVHMILCAWLPVIAEPAGDRKKAAPDWVVCMLLCGLSLTKLLIFIVQPPGGECVA